MRITGRFLQRRWNIPAQHVLYREDGAWYHHLERFPGALCDPRGYVVFRTRDEYERHPGLSHGVELNVPGGIASLSGYVRVVN